MKKKSALKDLKGALPKADKAVSLEDMDKAITQRSAGLIKEKLKMAEDFDAPLPEDIQAGFEGSLNRTIPRTREEQEWLDIKPVGREFGSATYEEDDTLFSTAEIKRVRKSAERMLPKGKIVKEKRKK